MTLQSGARSPTPGAFFTFTAGFVLAMVTCGGLLAQRVSRGDVHVAAIAHIILTCAVMLFAYGVRHYRELELSEVAPRIALQLVGAGLGIAVAHGMLQSSSLGAAPWLCERPLQLVNDAVAVFVPIALVWAATRRPPNTSVLVATLVIVTIYRLTGTYWHLDAGAFQHTVQELVTIELAGAALGVTAFQLLVPAP